MKVRALFGVAMSAALVVHLPAYGVTGEPDEKPPQRIFSETAEQKERRMAWWTHDRFGMFIHFGLYAAPARHEWMKSREGMSDKDYDRYFEHFNPDLYDAKEWARVGR